MNVSRHNMGGLARCMTLSLLYLLSDYGEVRAQSGVWPNDRDAYGQGFEQQRENSSVRRWKERSDPSSQPRRVRRDIKPASADGRLTLRNYVSGDNSETYKSPTVILSFLEADLHLKNLTESGWKAI